jgi:hypothetical protein
VESKEVDFEEIRGLLHCLPASASLEDSTTKYSAHDKAESPAELDKSAENLFEGQNMKLRHYIFIQFFQN